MGSSVRVKSAVVISPSEPTPSCVLPLSALDSQLFLRFTIEYLLVYKPSPALDHLATSARLKSALAKALVPYYPFAGRVRPRPGPDASGLEVLCRAQGAVFIEAFSDRYTANDFIDKAPKTVTHWRKFLSLYTQDVLKGSPPLVVQLTWLNDGAAAVGVGINHCICDGIGSAEFLNYFADLASGKSPAPKPVWNRHILSPRPIRPNKPSPIILPEFNPVPDLCNFMTRVSTDLKPTSITFDRRRLHELQQNAARSASQLSESHSHTCFEVLAAHVWRSWARALGFPSNQRVKLLFSINVRNRVKPGIPEGYYGNAFVLGCAVSERKGCPESVGVLIVSQWSRLGLERVDFGAGKPVNVGPVLCDRYCLFLPVNNQREAVKVMLAVPSSAVDHYQYLLTATHL
ncbi:taxadien-5-alpha-ol O-acetyltransferase-like [Senna tora]|uniref:Taxadien-5-alpha-ol O-acetyltransferase-like n=1 Tax=Senna tora TaxID=362788 RepID=A0A834WAT9_9FABA|nr:taxadien-5-alpha-ol O-acetyltransferase-like [Senna tora]